jgi:hypothetical protein
MNVIRSSFQFKHRIISSNLTPITSHMYTWAKFGPSFRPGLKKHGAKNSGPSLDWSNYWAYKPDSSVTRTSKSPSQVAQSDVHYVSMSLSRHDVRAIKIRSEPDQHANLAWPMIFGLRRVVHAQL